MSKWSEWKEAQGETKPWNLLDPNKYVEDEELGKTRLEICKACPELIKVTKICKKQWLLYDSKNKTTRGNLSVREVVKMSEQYPVTIKDPLLITNVSGGSLTLAAGATLGTLPAGF